MFPNIHRPSACGANCTLKALRRIVLAGTLGLIPGFTTRAFPVQPFSTCVVPGITASGYTLLLDPVARTPVALVPGPNPALTQNKTVVLQTLRADPDTPGVPLLQLTEVLPEFWAQPATWLHYLKGPTAWSGQSIQAGPGDWAGLSATDRRAYRLDPGLRPHPSATSLTPPGSGPITGQKTTTSFAVAWNGVAGRVYQLQVTTMLGKSFAVVDTLIASRDGQLRVVLPLTETQAFYRVAEIAP